MSMISCKNTQNELLRTPLVTSVASQWGAAMAPVIYIAIEMIWVLIFVATTIRLTRSTDNVVVNTRSGNTYLVFKHHQIAESFSRPVNSSTVIVSNAHLLTFDQCIYRIYDLASEHMMIRKMLPIVITST